jgi:hypothetical protein
MEASIIGCNVAFLFSCCWKHVQVINFPIVFILLNFYLDDMELWLAAAYSFMIWKRYLLLYWINAICKWRLIEIFKGRIKAR